jgi:hypothetical protein
MQQEHENRLYTRYPFSASAEIRDGSQAEMPSRVLNIGLGGGRLRTIGRLPIGAEITVKIRTSNDYFEALAEVVHSTATEVSVAFHHVGPTFFGILSRWIKTARSALAQSS